MVHKLIYTKIPGVRHGYCCYKQVPGTFASTRKKKKTRVTVHAETQKTYTGQTPQVTQKKNVTSRANISSKHQKKSNNEMKKGNKNERTEKKHCENVQRSRTVTPSTFYSMLQDNQVASINKIKQKNEKKHHVAV